MDETMGQGVGSGMPQPPPQQPAMALPPMGIPGAMPVGQPVAAMQPQPPPLHQEMNADDEAWWSDLKNNHVSPKSYKELLANKGTLGKIGSLFGLLLSGAGSGLTGQPNLVMQMMDKEIANDFESQKQNAANRVNFYSLAMQHERDKIAARSAEIDNQLKQAQIARNPAEIARLEQEKKMLEAQTKSFEAESQIKGTTAALNKQKLAMVHSLLGITDTMPDGPMKQKAATMVNDVILPGVIADNQARNQQAAGQVALHGTLNSQGMEDEPSFQKRMQALRLLGMEEQAKDFESKHIPGVPGFASRPIPEEIRTRVAAGSGFINELRHFKKWSEEHSGSLDPTEMAYGSALAQGLQNSYREAINGGVYKAGEQDFIAKAIDPDPTKFLANLRVVPKLEAVELNAAMQLENHLRSLGFSRPQVKGSDENKGKEEKPKETMANNDSPKSGTVERLDSKGRIVLYDAKTKQPIGYK